METANFAGEEEKDARQDYPVCDPPMSPGHGLLLP